MMKIRRVLLPTDFSPVAEGALPYAAHIASTHGAELHLLHVNVLDEGDPQVPGQSVAMAEKERTRITGRAAERLNSLAMDHALGGVKVFREVRWDVGAAPRIAEYAGGEEIDLVVMGTHGSRGNGNWLLGSVAADVIRTAPCSVLIVPARGEPPRRPSFRKILAPIDYSHFSREGLSVACELTLGYAARLELLFVKGSNEDRASHPADFIGNDGSAVGDLPWTEAAMSSFFGEIEGRRGISPGFNVRNGSPGREISRFAEDEGCDLIVMASLGTTGIDRFLLGSTAERVIASAHCPVLVVRPAGRSLLVAPQR